jgi:hypothetical protein
MSDKLEVQAALKEAIQTEKAAMDFYKFEPKRWGTTGEFDLSCIGCSAYRRPPLFGASPPGPGQNGGRPCRKQYVRV